MSANTITNQLSDEFYPVVNDKIKPLSSITESLKTHKFANTPLWQQAIFASDPYCNSGSKQYVAVNDVNRVIDYLKTHPHDDAHLYELLPVSRPVRPYFDIEYDAEQLSDKEVLETVLGAVATCLRQVGFTGSRGISIYTASGTVATDKITSGKKASFHVICDTIEVFKSVADHKRFIKDILFPYIHDDKEISDKLDWVDPKGDVKCALDHVPYKPNQTFRLPYQSKHSSSTRRCLVPYDVTLIGCNYSEVYTIGVYEDPSQLTLIEVAENTKPRSSKKKTRAEVKEGVESPEFPKVSALCDCLSIKFLQDYESAEHLIYLLCGIENTERMRELIHRICSKANNYEWKWVNDLIQSFEFVGIHIGTLVKWARDCAGKDAVATILNTHSVSYYKELFSITMQPENHVTIHERFLGKDVNFNDDTNTLIVKSHLGTGKTTAISNLMSRTHYDRILIVSPRKSYTYAIHSALDENNRIPSFQKYLDHSGPLSEFDKMIVQVESLHRVGEWFIPYDLVILDESESILNQLHSVITNGEHLINNHQILELVMRTARNVICADAFISDRTFHFVKQLRDSTKTKYVENTFNPYKREAIHLKSSLLDHHDANLGGFCDKIMTALRAGKKIVVLWTSKRVGEDFVERYLKKESFAYKFYNSDSTKEDQSDLKDVNVAWCDLKCLMYTTSITVGLSFDPQLADIEFDEIFLYGNYLTALPRDIAQSLLRVRVLKENRLTYVLSTPFYSDGSDKGLTNVTNAVQAKEEKVMKSHPLAKWILAPEWVRWNHVYNENEEKISRSEYERVLEQYLTNSGYTLKSEYHDVYDEVKREEDVKECEDKTAWNAIPDIKPHQAERIRSAIKKGEADGDDKLALKKYEFRTQFVEDFEEYSMKSLWDYYISTDSMYKFWNVVGEKRWSVGDLASAEARKRYAMMSSDRIKKRETMDRFLKIVGMNHSMEEVTIGPEKLAEIGPLLEGAEKELRDGMGLRASRRKADKWEVKHTIDLIHVILEEWCGAKVESDVVQIRKNKKITREYTLHINKDDTFWDKIKSHDIDDSKLLIKF